MLSEAEFAPVVFATIKGTATDSNAQTEHIDRAVEQAQVRGHAAGYATGLRAATAIAEERLALLEAAHRERAARSEARLDQAYAAMTAALSAVHQAVVPVVSESDDALLSAALELAEAVVARELSSAEDSATAALRRVFDALAGEREQPGLIVRLNPADAASLQELGHLPASLTIVADPGLRAGDAIAQLEDGVIDARIGTALQRAKNALIGEER